MIRILTQIYTPEAKTSGVFVIPKYTRELVGLKKETISESSTDGYNNLEENNPVMYT